MKFIKRDIDKRLLFLVIVLLVLLTLVTIYYEITLRSLKNRYNKSQEIFGGLTADAVLEEFNKTSSIKEMVQNYKEYLEKRYDDLNTMNKNLKIQIEELNAELRLVKSQIEYQKAKEAGPTEQFRLYQNKNEDINKLKEKIKELSSKVQSVNISDRNCAIS